MRQGSPNSAQIVAVAPVTLEHVCKACGATSRAVVGGANPEAVLLNARCPVCKKRGVKLPFSKDPKRLFSAVTSFGVGVGGVGIGLSWALLGAWPGFGAAAALIGLPLAVLYGLYARLISDDVRELRELEGRMKFLPAPPAEGPYRSAR